MHLHSSDCVVIGAGVVGLAVARKLAGLGREVLVLEAESGLGRHTSSRNSEVIHAGIYYATGSQKARLCVLGNRALYAYCSEHGVPHRRVGKLMVAVNDDEIPKLDRLRDLAQSNGVHDLIELSELDVRSLEPALVASRGILSPSTGILDSHALMRSLKADLEDLGGSLVLSTPVIGGDVSNASIHLDVGGLEPMTMRCTTVVNCAGLFAPRVARTLRGLESRFVPNEHFAKGNYFVLPGRSPFRHLVYPMSCPGVAHIHFTLDLAGGARFGPDTVWVNAPDYAFDDTRAPSFYHAIRRYHPALADDTLQPGFVGIRPKLGPEGTPVTDFLIQGPGTHGISNLVNLFGIESPGLTACLAIADEVALRLDTRSTTCA